MTKGIVWRLVGVIAFVVIISFGAVILFSPKNQQKTSPKIGVAVSFYPMGYLAEQIGGNKVEVTTLTPAGAEPHDYELTATDITTIEKSRLLILNGGGLEIWKDKLGDILRGSLVTEVVAGDGLTTKIFSGRGEEAGTDPHIWLDPKLAMQEAKVISQALVATDPTNESYYSANLAALTDRLIQLDQQYRTGLASCSRQDFVTSHEAFSYLASEYGLQQIAIAGLSPDEEPSSSDLAKTAELVRGNNIKYIFFESLVSPKLSNTIAKETGAQTLELNPIEGLTADEVSAGKNYDSLMKDNLSNLEIALECAQ